jgi:hypothetical protein
MELYELMLMNQKKDSKLPKRNCNHQHSNYTAVGTGVTFAPGDKAAHNFCLTKREEDLIHKTSGQQPKLLNDIKKFVESKFYNQYQESRT